MLSRPIPPPPPPDNAGAEIPKESRTGWTPLVCKKGEQKQIRIVCQRSNGHKNLFSSSPSAAKNRPNWAPIYDCELTSEKKKDIVQQKFHFVNTENEKKCFRADLLNPFIYSLNSFTQKCSELVVDNKLKLLAHYFSLTSKSEGYFSHSEDFDVKGFLLDGSGLKEKDLVEAGGSIKELESFQKLADENSFCFGGDTQAEAKDFRLSSLNKRKITDFFQKEADPEKKKNKLTKTERVEANFREEIESEGGLEKSFVKSYATFKSVHIDMLSVSPKLFLELNNVKIKDIADSIESQPDPAQLILTVCPVNIDDFGKPGTLDETEFFVIAGQHRLQALKLLDRQGKLDQVACIKNKKIPCFICKTDSAAGANFVNIRSNDISSKYKATANNEDLILIYSGLSKTCLNQPEAIDTVKRICYSRKTAAEDISALLKIIDWPSGVLEKLTAVLECFKKFKTLDATGYGVKARLKNREVKTLTKAQFRQLGRCKPEYFLAHHEKVINNETSLKDLLLGSQHSIELDKTACSFSQAAGHDDFEALKAKYPDRFDEHMLKKFMGAEVYGKKKNVQGQLMKNYVKQVKEGKVVKEPVIIKEIVTLAEVDGAELGKHDVIVLHTKSWKADYVKCLVDFAGSSGKDLLSVIVILPCEKYLQHLMKDLETWRDKEGFRISHILFDKGISVAKTCEVQENITFSVLFGKINIFQGDLFSMNHGTVESKLQQVVEKLSPPSGKVAYISDGNTSLIQVHPQVSAKSDCEVTYYAPKKSLDDFVKKNLVKVPEPVEVQEKITTHLVDKGNDVAGEIVEKHDENEKVEEETEEYSDGDVDDEIDINDHLLERKSSTSSLKYPTSSYDNLFNQ